MDGDRVDAWVSGVDELLAGRRDDDEVPGDAMRWAPEPPAPSMDVAMQEYVASWRRFGEALRAEVEPLMRRAPDVASGRWRGQEPDAVILDETHQWVADDQWQAAIETSRHRDTGPEEGRRRAGRNPFLRRGQR